MVKCGAEKGIYFFALGLMLLQLRGVGGMLLCYCLFTYSVWTSDDKLPSLIGTVETLCFDFSEGNNRSSPEGSGRDTSLVLLRHDGRK